jgi:Ig-like domain CHU_C associated
MRPLYTKFSLVFLFFFMLHANTPRAMVSSFDTELKPNKDKSKEVSNPIKPRTEVGGKTDRPKKDETLPTPTKAKRKVLPISPLVLTEDVKTPSFTPLSLTGKGIQPISSNFNKNVGPDPFRFTISSNKDSVAVGEEIELTVTVDWVDYGVNNGVRFLPEWYKYVLRVVTPKGFVQTGGDYTDFCTKPVDVNNPQAVFTIKGKFEYKSNEPDFLVLRGFEGSNAESQFIEKTVKRIFVLKKTNTRNAKIAATCATIDFPRPTPSLPNQPPFYQASRNGRVYSFGMDSGFWGEVKDLDINVQAKWDFGDGSFVFTNSPTSGNHTYAECALPRTVTLTMVINANGCYKTLTETITTQGLPTPTITTANNVFTICKGGGITLTAGNCPSGATLSWGSKTENPTISTDYTVNCTEGTGTTACITSKTQTVTVISNTLPIPTITSNAGGDAICSGGTVTLIGGGCSGGTLSWSPAIKVETLTSTTSYSITCSNGGCATPTTGTKTITVKPDIGTLGISVNPTNKTICAGSSATLSAGGCVTGSTYAWSNGSTGASITVSPTTSTPYTVTCSNPAYCSKSTTETVIVTPKLNFENATIEYDPASGEVYVLSGYFGDVTFYWTKPDGTGVTSTGIARGEYRESRIQANIQGIYTVYITKSGYCTSITYSKDLTPTLVTPIITKTINTCDVKLTATAGVGVSYQWSFSLNDQNYSNISGATNAFYYPTSVGYYRVTVSKSGYNSTSSDGQYVPALTSVSPPTNTSVSPGLITEGVSTLITIGGTCNNDEEGDLEWSKDNGAYWSSGNTNVSTTTTFQFRCKVTDSCISGLGSSQNVNVYGGVIVKTATPANASNCGASDGNISCTAEGGTGTGYQYILYANDGTTVVKAYQISNVFTSLVPGKYKVKAKDSNGVVSTLFKEATIGAINGASAPQNTSVSPNIVVSGTATTIILGGSCLTGGTLEWKKSIDNDLAWTTGTSTISTPTTYNFRCFATESCVSAEGTPQKVEDACKSSTLKISLTVNKTACGATTGSIIAAGSDGYSPYQYKKGSGGAFSSNSTFTDLASGNYKFFVRDNNGCEASDDGIVNTTNGPTPPSPTAGGNRTNPGTVTLSATCETGTAYWYIDPTGGNPLSTGPSYTPYVSATTDYFVACNSGSCESGRKTVTAIISDNPCPVKPIATNNSNTFNEGDGTNLVLQTPDCAGCTFAWYGPNGYYSGSRVAIISNPTWTVHNGVYTVVVSKSGCSSLSDNTTVTLGEPLVNPQIINQTPNEVTSFCGQGTFLIRASGCQNNDMVQWTVNGSIVNTPTIGNTISVYHIIKLRCKSINGTTLVGPERQIEFFVTPYSQCFNGNNTIVNKTPGGKTAFCTKGWVELFAVGCPDNNQVHWYTDNNAEINAGKGVNVIRGTITKTTTIGYNCIDPGFPNDISKEFSYKSITFTVGASGCNSPTPTLINNTTHQYDKFCGKGWVNLEVNGCLDNTKAKWYKNNTFVKEGIKFSEVINQTANYKVTCAGVALVAPNFAEITMQVFDFNDCTIPSAVNLTPDGQTEFCGSGALKLMMSGCGSTGGAMYEEHLDDGTYSTSGTAANAGFINDSRLAWEMIDGRNRLVLNYTALKSGYFKVFCPETNGQPKWNTAQWVYFKLNKLPTVSATNAPACVNKQATLNAEIVTDIPNNIGNVKYTWTDAAGQFISGSQTPSVLATNSTPTTYNVKFTDIKGCTATASTVVTNFALPVVTVQPVFNVCQGSPINLNATATVGSGKIKVDFNLAENTGLTDRTITLNITGTPTPNTSTVTIIQKAKSATCVKCGTNTFTDGQLFANQKDNINHKATIKIENGCAKAWWVSADQNGFINQDFYPNVLENKLLSDAIIDGCISFDGGNRNRCANNTRCDIGSTTDITNFTSAGGAGTFEIDLPSINDSWAVTKANTNDPITFTTASRPATPVNFTWYKNNLVQPMPINNAQSANGGVYEVTATDIRGCVGRASTNVEVILPVSVGIASNSTDGGTSQIETGDMLKVWANKVAGSSYEWMYSATDPTIGTGTALTFPMTPPTNYSSVAPFDTIYKNNIQVSDNGFYKVKVTDQYGCINHGNVKVLIQPFACKITALGATRCYIENNKRWAELTVTIKNRKLNWKGDIVVKRIKDLEGEPVSDASIINFGWYTGATTKNHTLPKNDKIPDGIYEVKIREKRSDEESGPGFECEAIEYITVGCQRKCKKLKPCVTGDCCGIPAQIDLNDEIKLETIAVDDVLRVNDFDMIVTKIITAPTPPTYQCNIEGITKVPVFDNVFIGLKTDITKTPLTVFNECKELVGGEIITLYNPANWDKPIQLKPIYESANEILDVLTTNPDVKVDMSKEDLANVAQQLREQAAKDLPKDLELKALEAVRKMEEAQAEYQKARDAGDTAGQAAATAKFNAAKAELDAVKAATTNYLNLYQRIVQLTLDRMALTYGSAPAPTIPNQPNNDDTQIISNAIPFEQLKGITTLEADDIITKLKDDAVKNKNYLFRYFIQTHSTNTKAIKDLEQKIKVYEKDDGTQFNTIVPAIKLTDYIYDTMCKTCTGTGADPKETIMVNTTERALTKRIKELFSKLVYNQD